MMFCRVCALPAVSSPCSERCHRLAAKKRVVDAKAAEVSQQIVEAIAQLRSGTTICPGDLAYRLTQSLGLPVASARDALALMRSQYLRLRNERKLRFFQKGVVLPITKFPKGPFRLGR